MQDAEAVRSLGASFLDHDVDSFGAMDCRVHAVLDALGREEDPELVQEYMDARYVSMPPPGLTRLCEEGALAVLRRRWGAGDRAESVPWLPDESEPAGAALLARLAALLKSVDDGRIAPPQLPLGGVAQEMAYQYAEYLKWARDANSGLRFGFPGRDLWVVESGRAEFASSQNQASEVKYVASPPIYSPRIVVPRIDVYGLTGLFDDDDER